ncbi:MAG: sialidase family protein, partial [Candidatus Poribacteria bacterium]|nr:sialidase family protein [Candidatus Poribacteria bacterium]
MLKIIDEGIISREPSRGAYMPTITPLPDGTFIACQHVGQALDSSDNHIDVLRSVDGGHTWVDEGSIHGEGPPDDGWTYRGPHISTVPDGRLVMTASRFQTGGNRLFDPETEALQRPEMVLFWSEDGGHTWSPPQVVPVDLPPEKYTWNGAGVLLQLAPNRWMYPLETWKPEGYAGPPDQKAAAVFSSDQGQTWGEFTVVADDTAGKLLWWDQMNTVLPDGRIYTLLWTHKYGTKEDLSNHWVVSEDQGRTWSVPRPTNLRGQVCTPIPLPDGRVAAIYNFRHEPQGIHVALTEDLTTYDVEREVVVFDAGAESTLGKPQSDTFLAEHLMIAFGKPGGILLPDGDLMTYFWCTVDG